MKRPYRNELGAADARDLKDNVLESSLRSRISRFSLGWCIKTPGSQSGTHSVISQCCPVKHLLYVSAGLQCGSTQVKFMLAKAIGERPRSRRQEN